VPGLVLLALLRPAARAALRADERLYLAVAASVCAASWVGLLLAELGRFSLPAAAALLGGASALACALGRRRLGPPLARPAGWRDAAPVALVLALAMALQAKPSEYIVGGRDPGAYVAAMAIVARTGGLVYTDPGVLSLPAEDVAVFFRNPHNPPFSWSRFMGFDLESPQSGRVFPQFFHLFPAFGAYLFQAMGVKGALATPSVFGILGTLGVFFALRRLWGDAVALVAATLLCLNVVQVWFARYPVSEPMSQFLLFLGLLALLAWEETGSRGLGALAGVAFGLSLLVRVDSVLILLPLGAYVFVRRARGEGAARALAPLLVPFALLLAHAALHAELYAAKYVHDILTRPYWRQPPALWAALALAAAAALWAAERLGARLLPAVERRADALGRALIAALLALGLYAYFLRPLLSAWAGADGNPQAEALVDPGLLRALGFSRLAAHDAQSLVRLGWFVSPLGLLLGFAGLALAIRSFRRRDLFPMMMVLAFSGFYLYKIRVWNDYYFALRRYLPVTLPFLLGFAALALVRLAARGRGFRLAAAGAGLLLAAQYVAPTRAIASHVDWARSVDFVRDVARRFGPRDVVVFEQPRSIHLLSLPLWSVHGANILELARFNPDPERLAHLIRAWRARYQNIYFVHTYRTDLCGVFLQRVEEHGFATSEWERSYGQPPRRAEARAFHFTVSRVLLPEELQVPALDELDVGGSDDFQVSGFFDKEGVGDRSYRWTGPCASVFLPGARAGAELVLTASIGRRPPSSPALVSASLAGVPLGRFTPGASFEEFRLRLPDPLPPGPPVLRLDVPAFRPANLLPGSDDVRDLGVMIDRLRVEGGPEARASIAAPPRGGAR
jgi:hypothetical protein